MASSDPAYTVSNVAAEAEAGDAQEMLNNFWQTTIDNIRGLGVEDFKTQDLPLARIKKIMKLDEDVKMISAEAPMLFAKAAEIFISELSLRAWIHTEDNKRRTLQKNDIAMAVTKYDQFDFLIDIVPRDELKPTRKSDDNVTRTSVMPDQVQYILQLAQQHQAALRQQQQPQSQVQQIQIQTNAAGGQVVQQPLQIQLAGNTGVAQGGILQVSQPGNDVNQIQTQVIQVQAPSQPQQQQQQQQQQPQQQQPQTTQVFQQIITPSGEVQNVPIQLTPEQIQALTSQMQGKQPGQPIMIQTQPQLDQQTDQQITQPLFQVPLSSVGGQQIFLQQTGEDVEGIQVTQAEVQS